MSNRLIAMLAVCAMLVAGPSAFAQTPVDLELSLVVDTSGSVSLTEFNLQKNGYVTAFQTGSGIQSQIDTLTNGIAVNLISFNTTAVEIIDWFHIGGTSGNSADDFANLINSSFNAPGGTNGGTGLTNIADGINLAASEIANNSFNGSNLIIDVSGDGFQNTELDGTSIGTGSTADQILRNERDAALAIVDRINGLPIGSSLLATYYTNNVIGGPDSFVVGANSFSAFAAAVDQKIEAEIQQAIVPVPGAAVAGLVMLGGIAMRRRRAA